jgi:hypothetical protein
MINHEALRMHMRLYAKAESQTLRDAMEHKLMELLRAQAEFDKLHNEFMGATMFMLREASKQ